MALQQVFKKGYMEYLKNNIDINAYRADSFEFDKSQLISLYGIEHPEGLLAKLDPKPEGDLATAIALYEAYPNLTPLLAQQDDLWVTLAHVDLFPYVKQRWPIPEIDGEDDIKKAETHIRNHWFRREGFFLRTIFAGLWWNVFMTIDDNREDHYELTKILFINNEFRTSSFGELPLIRHREAMIGILSFLKENPELFEEGFNARARYIQRLFNIISGYKNITSMDRSFFQSELEKRIDVMRDIHSVSEVHGDAKII